MAMLPEAMAAGTYWAHDARDNNIFSYEVEDSGCTTLSSNRFQVSADFLTTGFQSREEAVQWGKEWHACLTCKTVRKGTRCVLCGESLERGR